jgi:ubiquinone/menaquinone biosynthesis C-methylase UbiE
VTDPSQAKTQIVGVFNRSAGTYGQGVADFVRAAGADLVAAAGLLPGQRVLDVGCGRGATLFPASAAVGPDGLVVGEDLAPAMVAATAAEARRRGLTHVEVRLGDAEAPGGPDAWFDAVLAGLVIFFLPDAPAAARAYRRVLGPGGRLALSTFVAERDGDVSLAQVLRAALVGHVAPAPEPAPAAAGPSPEARLRTRESLAALLTGAGFADIAFEERRYAVRFADAGEFWDWLWSHGARAALELVPVDRLDAARESVGAVATDRLGAADGTLVLPIGVRLTTATRGDG